MYVGFINPFLELWYIRIFFWKQHKKSHIIIYNTCRHMVWHNNAKYTIDININYILDLLGK